MSDINYNTDNEIIKKKYEEFLLLDNRLIDKSIKHKVNSLRKYEEFTGFKDFKTFDKKQGLLFKEHYKKEEISNQTIYRNLENIKNFFKWLSRQDSYKRNIKIDDIKSLNLSLKEQSIARTRTISKFPTLEQVYKVIRAMPSETIKEKRDRAFISYAILTGARIGALMTFKVKTINEYKKYAEQNPNDGVKTKSGKYIITKFFPINKEIEDICLDWLKYMKEDKGRGEMDYLFPAFKTEIECGRFKRDILSKERLRSDTNIRALFIKACENAGVEYFNPHSLRKTLINLGYKTCKTPEEFKAWSQNIGHKSPLTTFVSYGAIDYNRQLDVIEEMSRKIS